MREKMLENSKGE